jgi:hypothetical protein
MNSSSGGISAFAGYFLDFIFFNPAFYAALFIPICIKSTVRHSINYDKTSKDILTWIEISAQIGCVIALAFANLIPLAILSYHNWDYVLIRAFTIALFLFYLSFIVGFKISERQFEEYKQRLGLRLPPWGNKITKARLVGLIVEILIPTYVYYVVHVVSGSTFKVPEMLPSLRL